MVLSASSRVFRNPTSTAVHAFLCGFFPLPSGTFNPIYITNTSSAGADNGTYLTGAPYW